MVGKIVFSVFVLLFIALAALLVISAAERPKFRPMNTEELIQWYSAAVSKSVLQSTQYLDYIAFLKLSQQGSCFELTVSTEPVESRNPLWRPAWSLNGENCVDKRTYKCPEEK